MQVLSYTKKIFLLLLTNRMGSPILHHNYYLDSIRFSRQFSIAYTKKVFYIHD